MIRALKNLAQPSWLHVVALVALLTQGIWITQRQWLDIFRFAGNADGEFQHIYLVPYIALFLIWVRRERIKHLRVSGTLIGPILIAAGWVAAHFGLENRVLALFHLSAILVVVGCIVCALGKQALFRFFPAVLVLVMMVPAPGRIRQDIAQNLQKGTAEIAQRLLEIGNVHTTVEGNTLSINGQAVNVDEACNGMRLVFPLFLLGYAFAFSLPLRMSVRLTLVGISPIVALVCNVLRTLPIIWLYGQGPEHKELAQRVHDWSGWVMLPLAFIVLLGLIRVLRWMAVPVERFTLASQGS